QYDVIRRRIVARKVPLSILDFFVQIPYIRSWRALDPMSSESLSAQDIAQREYRAGFVTDIESESVPAGLSEDVIRLISAKKGEPEWLLEWRLKAYRHWLTMTEPTWANVHHPPIDYQSIAYYSAPKQKKDGPKTLADVDPKLLETHETLGVPLHERAKR